MTHLAVRGALTKAEADSVRISEAKLTTHPRLDIDDFSTNGEYEIRWSLYLRALAALQAEGMNSDPFGYFQLAGNYGCFMSFVASSLETSADSNKEFTVYLNKHGRKALALRGVRKGIANMQRMISAQSVHTP